MVWYEKLLNKLDKMLPEQDLDFLISPLSVRLFKVPAGKEYPRLINVEEGVPKKRILRPLLEFPFTTVFQSKDDFF